MPPHDQSPAFVGIALRAQHWTGLHPRDDEFDPFVERGFVFGLFLEHAPRSKHQRDLAVNEKAASRLNLERR